MPKNFVSRDNAEGLMRGVANKIPQKSVLPTAAASNLGAIYQYIGATVGNTLINGYFYKCVSDGATVPTYSWVQTDIQPGGSATVRNEKTIATAADFRQPQGAYSFKATTAVTITLADANTITIPANIQGIFDVGETDATLNDYIGLIQYTNNGYEKKIYFTKDVFYLPSTDSVQIDDNNVSSATTYSSAKIETAIGGSKASQMVGATSYQDGKEGLATKPLAGDNQKALFGDGKYHSIYAANTGSTVVVTTNEPTLYSRPVTLTAGSTTLSGTFSATGECTFSNLAIYGAVQISSSDSEGNLAKGSTNITYFGTYVVGVGFNFATIKFISTDVSLVGEPVAVYFGNNLVAETSMRLVNGSIEGVCYVEQLGTYKAIAETSEGTARASVTVTALKQTFTKELIIADIYGFVIDNNDSNPATCVKPYDLNDYEVINKTYTPAYMDYTNDEFNYGSWSALATCDRSSIFFAPKPCMLGYDGAVDYYLDPDDYSKKADGTASDVADMNYNGNVMIEFPTIYFKRWQVNNKSYCLIANKQLDADFHAWAHYDVNGDVLPHIYISAYDGAYDGTRMRSISGCGYNATLASGNVICQTTRQQEIDFAMANNLTGYTGEGWYIRHKADWDMVNDLLILIGMSTDTQTPFGRGNDSRGDNGCIGTGTMNTTGMFWGSNNGTSGVKVFGIENWWANIWKSCAGWFNDKGTQKVKYTYGTEDGSTSEGFNITADGYVSILEATPTDGYISAWRYGDYGILPYGTINGASNKYLCDNLWGNTTVTCFPLVGGLSNLAFGCGAFCSYLGDGTGRSGWYIGAALSYKPLA